MISPVRWPRSLFLSIVTGCAADGELALALGYDVEQALEQ